MPLSVWIYAGVLRAVSLLGGIYKLVWKLGNEYDIKTVYISVPFLKNVGTKKKVG